MTPLKNIEKRIAHIIKNERLMFNIGDIQRITNLKSTQIHYWEHEGYITSIKRSKNHNHLYSYTTLMKIEIIQSYLKSGFTLKAANQKASQGYRYSNLLRNLVTSRFRGIANFNGDTAIDFGTLTLNNIKYQLFFILKTNGKTTVKIVKRVH